MSDVLAGKNNDNYETFCGPFFLRPDRSFCSAYD